MIVLPIDNDTALHLCDDITGAFAQVRSGFVSLNSLKRGQTSADILYEMILESPIVTGHVAIDVIQDILRLEDEIGHKEICGRIQTLIHDAE